MSDSILDNQEVTAEVLNDIAVDLGKADFAEFSNDTPFGADKLNSITSAIVSKGVLNSGSCCRPEINGNTLIIYDGIVVFESGAKIKIKDNISLPLQPNTYIYAVNNTTANVCQIIAVSELMTSGDFVAIAEIDGDSKLIDRRAISTSKFAVPSTPSAILLDNVSLKFDAENDIEHTVYVGTENFSFVLHRKSFHGNSFADLSKTDTIWIGNYEYLSFRKEGKNLIIITHKQGGGTNKKTLSFYVI